MMEPSCPSCGLPHEGVDHSSCGAPTAALETRLAEACKEREQTVAETSVEGDKFLSQVEEVRKAQAERLRTLSELYHQEDQQRQSSAPRQDPTSSKALNQAQRYADEVMRYHRQREEEGHPVLSPRSLSRVLALRAGESLDEQLGHAASDVGRVSGADEIDDDLADADVGFERAGRRGLPDSFYEDIYESPRSARVAAAAKPSVSKSKLPASADSPKVAERAGGAVAADAFMYVYDEGGARPQPPKKKAPKTVPRPFALADGGGGHKMLSRRVREDLEREAAEAASKPFRANPVPKFVRERTLSATAKANASANAAAPSSPQVAPPQQGAAEAQTEMPKAAADDSKTPSAAAAAAAAKSAAKSRPRAVSGDFDLISKPTVGLWRDPIRDSLEAAGDATPFRAKPLPEMYKAAKSASPSQSPGSARVRTGHKQCAAEEEPPFRPAVNATVPDFERKHAEFSDWMERTRQPFAPTIPREFTIQTAERSNYDRIVADIERDAQTLREARWPFRMTRGRVESPPVVTSYAGPRTPARSTFSTELRAATARKKLLGDQKLEEERQKVLAKQQDTQAEISAMLFERSPQLSMRTRELETRERIRTNLEGLRQREAEYREQLRQIDERQRATRLLLVERQSAVQAARDAQKRALGSVGGTGLSRQQFHDMTRESVRFFMENTSPVAVHTRKRRPAKAAEGSGDAASAPTAAAAAAAAADGAEDDDLGGLPEDAALPQDAAGDEYVEDFEDDEPPKDSDGQ